MIAQPFGTRNLPSFLRRRPSGFPVLPPVRTAVRKPKKSVPFFLQANVGNHHLYSKGCITWFAIKLKTSVKGNKRSLSPLVMVPYLNENYRFVMFREILNKIMDSRRSPNRTQKPAKTTPGTHCWNRTTVPKRGQGSTPDDRAGDSQGLTRTPTASFQGVRARETRS